MMIRHRTLEKSNGKASRNEKELQGKPKDILLMKDRVWKLLAPHRIILLIAAHILILSFTFWIAFQVRFDLVVPADGMKIFWQSLPWVIAVKIIIFYRFGSFHGWWRYVTFADLVSLLRVATLSVLIVACLDYFLFSQYQIPRAVLAIDWGATVLLLGGCRSIWRFGRESTMRHETGLPTFLVAADEGAENLIRQIHGSAKLNYHIIGLLSQDRNLHGLRLNHIPFLGAPEHAVPLASYHDVHDVLVMANSISGKGLRNLMEWCRQADIDLKMIPSVDHLLNGSYVPLVRNVRINDLLRRDQVQLEWKSVRQMIAGNRVMVTGAGGSIGSEICRQILECNPSSLLLVERTENSLYAVDLELREANRHANIVACVADIQDEERMHAIFRTYAPELVFHTAAHKHVPLMEDNAGEAIKNNVFGTKLMCEMADEYGVERFVLISTDKAVNPTSIMGVTKQLAERFVMSIAQESHTDYVVVRFGNVLASAGSVVPRFQEQIRSGGPVTITHPDMRRFFMTIPEASQLVLQAAAMGTEGEIYVLDMGEQIKIVDVVNDLIELSGLSQDDIEIKITGIRPGEKLHEELTFDFESLEKTAHPKINVARGKAEPRAVIEQLLEELLLVLHEPHQVVREKLRKLVPSFNSNSNGEVDEMCQPSVLVGARSDTPPEAANVPRRLPK